MLSRTRTLAQACSAYLRAAYSLYESQARKKNRSFEFIAYNMPVRSALVTIKNQRYLLWNVIYRVTLLFTDTHFRTQWFSSFLRNWRKLADCNSKVCLKICEGWKKFLRKMLIASRDQLPYCVTKGMIGLCKEANYIQWTQNLCS